LLASIAWGLNRFKGKTFSPQRTPFGSAQGRLRTQRKPRRGNPIRGARRAAAGMNPGEKSFTALRYARGQAPDAKSAEKTLRGNPIRGARRAVAGY